MYTTLILLSTIAVSLVCSISQEDFFAEWNQRLTQANVVSYGVAPNGHSTSTRIQGLFRNLGNGNRRVEAIQATIRNPLPPPRSREGFSQNDRLFMHNILNAQTGDEMGHILGWSIGGSTHRDNLFPQHQCINRNSNERHLLSDWVGYETMIREHMTQHPRGGVNYRIMFDFSSNSNRPTHIRGDVVFLDNWGNFWAEEEFTITNGPGHLALPSVRQTRARRQPPNERQCRVITFAVACAATMHNIFRSDQ